MILGKAIYLDFEFKFENKMGLNNEMKSHSSVKSLVPSVKGMLKSIVVSKWDNHN